MQSAGSEVEVIWGGRRVLAFVPYLLNDRELALDVPTAGRAAAAAKEVEHAAEALDPDYEPLARLLLRAEGVASSYIEGVTAPVIDIVLAEEQIGRQDAGTAAWVASNLAAVTEAVAEPLLPAVDAPGELTADTASDEKAVASLGIATVATPTT